MMTSTTVTVPALKDVKLLNVSGVGRVYIDIQSLPTCAKYYSQDEWDHWHRSLSNVYGSDAPKVAAYKKAFIAMEAILQANETNIVAIPYPYVDKMCKRAVFMLMRFLQYGLYNNAKSLTIQDSLEFYLDR